MARLGIALALLPLLSGCVAAVAIPLVAGGTLYARQHGVFVRAATRATQGAGTSAALVSATPALSEESPIVLTNLTELPPPTPADLGASPWQPFIDHALEQGAALAKAERPQSALIVADGLFAAPNRRSCTTRHPAVIVDLDKAQAAFSPGPGAGPPAGLAAGLARLREAGVVVLWLSQLPAARVGEVAAALRASGLDPQGKDQFLLIRGGEDRKQVLREQANQDVCIVAVAGDQRSDFDELFDYLRDPDGAAGLDAMLGDGWFLVPPPLEPPAR
jgi:hypothetical protein